MHASKIEIILPTGGLTLTDATIEGEGLQELLLERATNHILHNRMTLTISFNNVSVKPVQYVQGSAPQPSGFLGGEETQQ